MQRPQRIGRGQDFFFRFLPPFFFFFGTFLPSRRASDSPMALACLRLFPFFPLPPLFSVPRLRLRIAPSTFLDAPFEYLRAIPLLRQCLNVSQRGATLQVPLTVVPTAEVLSPSGR